MLPDKFKFYIVAKSIYVILEIVYDEKIEPRPGIEPGTLKIHDRVSCH